jgi:hypothetical protein
MGRIFEYVLWRGHDCDGTMPALDVLAGVLAASPPMLADDEVMVVVPPQWLGDWAEGVRLAPCYQHLWRVSLTRLYPLTAAPPCQPYRPATLPASATGSSTRARRRRA